MLKNTRKSIRKKSIKPNITKDNSVVKFDMYGFYDEMSEEEQKIMEEQEAALLGMAMRAKKDDPLQIVSTLLREIGLSRPMDAYLFDYSDVLRFVYDIGNRTKINVKGKNLKEDIIDALDEAIKYEVRYDQIDSDDEKDDPQYEIIINGFVEDDDGEWYNEERGNPQWGMPINIIGHGQEGLFCPACKAEFTSMAGILLGQTVSSTCVNASFAPDVEPVKISKPHLVMTPICPNCYCERFIANRIDQKIDDDLQTNASHIFSGTDADKRIIPLLPLCLKNKIKTESNKMYKINPGLYWPNEDIDMVCDQYIYNKEEEQEDDS